MGAYPRSLAATVILTLLSVGSAYAGPTDAQKCQSDKLKRTGKYYFCRLKEESKAVKRGSTPDYAKCDQKIESKFGKAEARWGLECPTIGDADDIRSQATADADFIADRLSGVRFLDNGDGTVTDIETGLMWERKDSAAGLHFVGDTFVWHDAMSEWLSSIAGPSIMVEPKSPGLGGHNDWRLPSVDELLSIADCSFGPPCIDPVFGSTASAGYWSSTSSAQVPDNALVVFFDTGDWNDLKKDGTFGVFHVRAVRDARND